MENLYLLSRTVFPDDDFGDAPELFYRKKETCYLDPSTGPVRGERISFDTWMNLFPAKKYHAYCALGNIYLRVQGKGKGRILLVGHTLDVTFSVIDDCLYGEDVNFAEGAVTLQIPAPFSYDGISFAFVHAACDDAHILEAEWCTDAAPQRRQTIAIVTCTYRREAYIRKTIRKFTSFLQDAPELAGQLHLFVIDNGRTLAESDGNRYATILPNKNAGGAGGFARGLMEANDRKFTRCLFMDDDVQIFPETFSRTLYLAEYLKPEYQDAFLSGSMIDLYHKNQLFEILACRNGYWVAPYHSNYNLDHLYNVLKANDLPSSLFKDGQVDSAWWYACFSLKMFSSEYPIPAFIRGDDVEWSWRKPGTHHIYLNGICIWHAPFLWRVGRITDFYYFPRNMFLVHAIHNPDFREEYAGYLDGIFSHLRRSYDYISIELFLMALEDILKGWRSYAEDPEEKHAALRNIASQAHVVPCHEIKELERVRDHDDALTTASLGIANEGWCDDGAYKGKRIVKVFNLMKKSYEVRRKDEAKDHYAVQRYQALMHTLHDSYDALLENLRQGYEIFKTRAFWDRYLGLNGKE